MCIHATGNYHMSGEIKSPLCFVNSVQKTSYIFIFLVHRGETAFFYLKTPIAWAKRPMLERLDVLDRKIPITMMYGTRTWFDIGTGEKIYAMRPDSYVDVHYFKNASHHIHADTPSIFNDIVNDVCDLADTQREILKRKDPETAFHSHFISEVAGSTLLRL